MAIANVLAVYVSPLREWLRIGSPDAFMKVAAVVNIHKSRSDRDSRGGEG
jgi:hypothetical protein